MLRAAYSSLSFQIAGTQTFLASLGFEHESDPKNTQLQLNETVSLNFIFFIIPGS